ncbi:aminoglycoside phosphotransferase (APT) family kinase protein [Marmoricola sp. URHA0025 HA25]
MTLLPAAPVGTAGVPAVPHGRTARRLGWRFLPSDLRALVEERLGGRVVDAISQDSGFTPGFASVLTTSAGTRGFVKAASKAAQAEIASSYAEEARKLSVLGDSIPAPRLEWVHEDDAWVVLGFEAVAARQPARPWRPDELDRALDLAEAIADATETVPDGLDLRPIVEDLPGLVTGWESVADDWPHRADAAALAALMPTLPDSDRFAHSDLRDDNILFADDGRTLACDWNWPALAPAWLDLVVLLASAHGDGLPVEDLLAERALTREVDPVAIDVWLAALCGFMLSSRTRPVPASSPHLRAHASWYAEAAWSWLAQRRGWD